MSHTPHELAQEFPEHAEKIHLLKESDVHFSKIADEYHVVNREVHRAEENIEPIEDLHMSALRKRRMTLKDEIYAILSA